MIPAGPHPLLMCGDADPIDEFFKIERAVRLNAPDGAHFTWTNGVPTDQTKWTAVLWIKRTLFAENQCILSGKSGGTTAEVAFYSTENLAYRGLVDGVGSTQGALDSVRVYRDPGAYTPLLLNYDASRAASSRIKAYDERGEIAFSVLTNIGLCNMNTSGATVRLGRTQYNAETKYAGFNVAEFHFIDGQILLPDMFWRKHPRTEQCRPIRYLGTYGANGRYYDFIDGSAATSAALGKDRSGNNNDATPVNISVAVGVGCDWVLDTPTNNFATLNPITPGAVAPINGALDLTVPGGVHRDRRATFAIPPTGLWYAEEKTLTTCTSLIAASFALVGASRTVDTNPNSNSTAYWGMYSSSGRFINRNGVDSASLGSSLPAGTVLQIAADPANNRAWLGVNNVWYDGSNGTTGDPAAGLNPTFSGLPAELFIQAHANGNTMYVNFGQRPFDYTPPAGFKALCTKNLPIKPLGGLNPASGFKVTLATEDNIYAQVASARAGWTDYVDILKNRDIAESWAWQFSHDSTNEYAIAASSVVRQAKRAQSGSNRWAGFSIKIGQQFGTAAGSVSHTNGAATTVTHNVGLTTRQMILLFPRGGGSSVKVYHPDLTAGKLLDMCAATGEVTDTAIGTVTSASFQIGSAMATGTYDYLVLSELSGFFSLGKASGNSSADGPFPTADQRDKMLIWKNSTPAATDGWACVDSTINPTNPCSSYLYLNTNSQELSYPLLDLCSNGRKVRTANQLLNTSGQVYVFAAFAEFPFRYANAK